jgi:hypothetical protein
MRGYEDEAEEDEDEDEEDGSVGSVSRRRRPFETTRNQRNEMRQNDRMK